ncbi:MAG: PAS domain S-box protein [Candidatus Margulisbacteria bacterium]|nr:PAS domain S-box protein [Candidatus Margulisiibacteriota bacterium]
MLSIDNERTKYYLNLLQVMVVAINAEGEITLVNQKGAQALGYEIDDLVGKNWFETCIPSYCREKVKRVFVKVMYGELEPIEYNENPIITMNEDERLIAWHNTYLRDNEGIILGIIASGEDITDYRRAEDELFNIKDFYRNILESIEDGVFVTDKNDSIYYVNHSFALLAGISLYHLIGKNIFNDFPGENMGLFKEEYLKAKQNLQPVYYDMIHLDLVPNKPVVVSGWLTPKTKNNQFDGMICTMEDMTEHTKTIEALKDSEQVFKAISFMAKDAIILVDSSNSLVFWNKAAEEMFGYKLEEARGKNLHELIGANVDQEKIGKHFEHFHNTGEATLNGKTMETIVNRRDGSAFPMEMSVSSVKIKDTWHAIGIARDISDRKKLVPE